MLDAPAILGVAFKMLPTPSRHPLSESMRGRLLTVPGILRCVKVADKSADKIFDIYSDVLQW